MKISVVVCTHNRCELMRDALRSVMMQDFPTSDYEVIVVDNNSTDRTKDVVQEFVKDEPGAQVRGTHAKHGPCGYNTVGAQVRYVLEENLGLSYARNRGINEAHGDIIAFIDDDATADKSWLSKLAQVYDKEKDVACVGGRVIADWPIVQPSWWHPALNYVSKFNPGFERIILNYPVFSIGTNISYKKDILVKLWMFDCKFGRTGSKMLAYEEADIGFLSDVLIQDVNLFLWYKMYVFYWGIFHNCFSKKYINEYHQDICNYLHSQWR